MLFYPKKQLIGGWANIVASLDNLRDYLPAINDSWVATIESEITLTAMHPDRDDLAKSAARLFYRIIKNHRFIDGNKRSAVINTYLLVLYNRNSLQLRPQVLYELSRLVAESQKPQETTIDELAQLFEKHLQPIE